MFHYSKHNPYSAIIVDAKYHSRPELSRYFGRKYAGEIAPDGFFLGVDALVPVPMHWMKKVRRGYNQAEEIAQGISEVTGIEIISDALRAARHSTQTRKGVSGRRENARSIYSVADPGLIEGKHILLVDDVITTGATLVGCCEAIHASAPGCHVSVVALAATAKM